VSPRPNPLLPLDLILRPVARMKKTCDVFLRVGPEEGGPISFFLVLMVRRAGHLSTYFICSGSVLGGFPSFNDWSVTSVRGLQVKPVKLYIVSNFGEMYPRLPEGVLISCQ
jgi:hypothetical protein